MKKDKTILTIATRNPGKLREIVPALSGLPVEIKSLKDFPFIGEIRESGKTFAENAVIKARGVHAASKGYVLADDSGLVCEDLRGEPGIHSSRYSGPQATDEENNRKLVAEIAKSDDPSRRAAYVCVLCLIDPDGAETLVEERCEGMITLTPGGTGGFGYDPYFFLPAFDKTMAEIPIQEKNKISHRGKALKKIFDILKEELR